jgi:hypothetical protein
MKKIIIIISCLIALLAMIPICSSYYSIEEVDVFIKDKIVKRGSNSDKYLIFTENEVFENTDCVVFGKFDSSDVFNSIENKTMMRLEVYGWRINFLSKYRNILSAKKLERE